MPEEFEQHSGIFLSQLRQILTHMVPRQLSVRVNVSSYSGLSRSVQCAHGDVCQPIIL
jgi:hypothetical protein